MAMNSQENTEKLVTDPISEVGVCHKIACAFILISAITLIYLLTRTYFSKKNDCSNAKKIDKVKQSFKLLRQETKSDFQKHCLTITNTLRDICLDTLTPEEKMRLFWLCVKTTESIRISQVTEYLFVSGVWGLNITKLKNLGITLVINATKKYSPLESDIKTINLQIEDNEDFNILPFFRPVSKLIKLHADQGGKVLVHCHAGISRSVSICCAYLMTNYGMTAYESLELVRDKRRIAKPNPRFMKDLLNYEDLLKKSKIGNESEEICDSLEIIKALIDGNAEDRLKQIIQSCIEISLNERKGSNIDAVELKMNHLNTVIQNILERMEKIEKLISEKNCSFLADVKCQ